MNIALSQPDLRGVTPRARFACRIALMLLRWYDPVLWTHSHAVARAARRLAPTEHAAAWYWAGLLHDIGKLELPRAFWSKPGNFADHERAQARRHPVVGARFLRWLGAPVEVARGAYYHHERWNGTGYPHDIGREEIPLIGRALAIADVSVALQETRSYRAAVPASSARAYLERYAGSLFDPDLVAQFLEQTQ